MTEPVQLPGDPGASAPAPAAPPAVEPVGEPTDARRGKSARARASGGKRKKAELPSPDQVRGPAEAIGQRRAWWAALLYLTAVVAIVGVGLAELYLRPGEGFAHVHLGAMILAVAVGLGGVLHALAIHARGRLAGARALIDAELWDAAIPALKALAADNSDEATYLVGVAYDRQGARRLALESYRSYLKRHRRGVWVVEATVRVEELEALPSPTVQALVRDAGASLVCPYCRSAITDSAVTVECSGCATPHHIGCYEEQGGCSVYGCQSRGARARVRE